MPEDPDRAPYQEVLKGLGLPGGLASYDARVIGTPPLGLAVANSDIDIACFAENLTGFAEEITRRFGREAGFCLQRREIDGQPTQLCRFSARGWPVEIFAQPRPVQEQQGFRHFLIEQRLLTLLGDGFRQRVAALRLEGMKTEPAFAAALGLQGDPYQALLSLEGLDSTALRGLYRAKTAFLAVPRQ